MPTYNYLLEQAHGGIGVINGRRQRETGVTTALTNETLNASRLLKIRLDLPIIGMSILGLSS